MPAAHYRLVDGPVPGEPLDPAEPMDVAGVLFSTEDAEDGAWGTTPNNRNVGYLGFVAWLTAREFLSLNPPREVPPNPGIHQRMAQGEGPVGFLTLYANPSEQPDGSLDFRVRSHEGRGRALALLSFWEKTRARVANMGGIQAPLYPVHVIPEGGLRARHLSPEQLLRGVLVSDKRAPRTVAVPLRWVTLDGVTSAAPWVDRTLLAAHHAGAQTQRRALQGRPDRG